MSTSDVGQITSHLRQSVESSCVSRSNSDHRRRAIPRATATRRLRFGFSGRHHHAPVNDLLLTSLLSGNVKMTSPVNQLTRTGVRFTDGTYVDNVDTIVCATGQFYPRALPALRSGMDNRRSGPAKYHHGWGLGKGPSYRWGQEKGMCTTLEKNMICPHPRKKLTDACLDAFGVVLTVG